VPIVLKSGSLNLLEPSGPVQACTGIAFFTFLPVPNSTAVQHFYYNLERWDIYHWAAGPVINILVAGTMDKTFYNLLSKQGLAAAPVTSTFFSFIAFLEAAFIRNKKKILCINYNYYMH